jgi:hypothetical protein
LRRLGCLVSFGVWPKEPLFGAILAKDSTSAFCPSVNQAIFGELLFAENIPIVDLSINVERKFLRAKQGAVWGLKGWLPWRHKDAFSPRCERFRSFSEILWGSRKHLVQRVLGEPSVYPPAHAVSRRLAAIPEMDLRFGDIGLREPEDSRVYTDVGP